MGTSTSRYVRKKKTTKEQEKRKKRLSKKLNRKFDELNNIKK